MRTPWPAFALGAALALGACAGDNPGAGHPRPSSPAAAPAGALTPQNEALLYINVIEGLVKQQRYGAALAFLDDFAAKQKSPGARYWLLRGDALLGLDHQGDAAAAYGELKGTPLAAQGWNGQGRVAAAGRQWRAAAANFQKAVQGDPSNADFLNNLAFADMHLGACASAAAYLRQAHELAPGSELIRNNLIIALSLTGDPGGADAILRDIKDGGRREQARAVVKSAIESGNLTRDDRS